MPTRTNIGRFHTRLVLRRKLQCDEPTNLERNPNDNFPGAVVSAATDTDVVEYKLSNAEVQWNPMNLKAIREYKKNI